jgi:leucyl/phenylalanyl-tRNA--protein transferase
MIRESPFWINPDDASLVFPDVSRALREPDGLLAVGGDLTPERIMTAYRQGIFPWYSDNQPILWWSPDPRTVLYPGKLKVSRSLRKTLRQRPYTLTMDRAFRDVVNACAQPRPGSSGTWITRDMADAYHALHQRGYAHSVECWHEGQLAGGLYGVVIGRVFFGESMFSRVSNASKIAFVHLVHQLQAWDYGLIDCQVYSTHLASLGAEEISRDDFIRNLNILCLSESMHWQWNFDPEIDELLW